MSKIINVASCLTCPERDVIRSGKLIGKSWCGFAQRVLPDTLSKFPEFCPLDDHPSNTRMHVDEDPCACNQDRKEMIKEGFSFCHWCGRGLHQ